MGPPYAFASYACPSTPPSLMGPCAPLPPGLNLFAVWLALAGSPAERMSSSRDSSQRTTEQVGHSEHLISQSMK